MVLLLKSSGIVESKTVTVVPLSSTNHSKWKIQSEMALIRDGLWGCVNETETVPMEGVEAQANFAARHDKALATIVLAIMPSLLYLTGADPTDPVVVWKALTDQFQRKTWVNKLDLKQKLFSMRLREGGSVQDHIKYMIEMCDELSVIGEAISEEALVVYLLASLPANYSVLVTALETSAEVHRLTVVRECLLHEETKMKSKSNQLGQEEAITSSIKKKQRCHYCNKFGHFNKECEEFAKVKGHSRPPQINRKNKMGAFKVTITAEDENSTDNESTGLMAQHALSTEANTHNQWISDCGATCQTYNEETNFSSYQTLDTPLNIIFGDGRNLQAIGCGDIVLKMNLP